MGNAVGQDWTASYLKSPDGFLSGNMDTTIAQLTAPS